MMDTSHLKNKKGKEPEGEATGRGPRRKNLALRKRKTTRGETVRSEFVQKMIDMRRVARVVAGGRRFSFSVVLIIGNKNGSVGVGVGKGSDTATAIDKALKNAKKNMIQLKLTDTMSIPYETSAKYNSARILIIPVSGKGLVAGSAVRTVLDLAGVTDVISKVLSPSKNKLNIARATVEALKKLT